MARRRGIGWGLRGFGRGSDSTGFDGWSDLRGRDLYWWNRSERATDRLGVLSKLRFWTTLGSGPPSREREERIGELFFSVYSLFSFSLLTTMNGYMCT